jgi:hypothetical protein
MIHTTTVSMCPLRMSRFMRSNSGRAFFSCRAHVVVDVATHDLPAAPSGFSGAVFLPAGHSEFGALNVAADTGINRCSHTVRL